MTRCIVTPVTPVIQVQEYRLRLSSLEGRDAGSLDVPLESPHVVVLDVHLQLPYQVQPGGDPRLQGHQGHQNDNF